MRAYERGRVERRKEKKERECEKDAASGKGGEGGCERGGAEAGQCRCPQGVRTFQSEVQTGNFEFEALQSCSAVLQSDTAGAAAAPTPAERGKEIVADESALENDMFKCT